MKKNTTGQKPAKKTAALKTDKRITLAQQPAWLSNETRDSQYAEQQGIFMVHKVVGSTKVEGKDMYRIKVYLSSNPRRNSLDQVVEARFFLGRAFKYEMVTRTRNLQSAEDAELSPSEFFRFEAQTESEALCLGEVTLKDGRIIKLVSRWLDLEQAASPPNS